MATRTLLTRPGISFNTLKWIARTSPLTLTRALNTLPNNPHIYVHEPSPTTQQSYLYTLLPTTPPTPSLSIGHSKTYPPTPETFHENHDFLSLLHHIIAENASSDPDVQAQAATFASQAGSALGSGGAFFPNQPRREGRRRTQAAGGGAGAIGGDGAGGASAQGGMGGAGRGGYIHVSDQRNPPDFGRVAWPEDMFGSLELDGKGEFVDGTGRYQRSGTYRVMTNEGTLGLSEYLRGKLMEKLEELERAARRNG